MSTPLLFRFDTSGQAEWVTRSGECHRAERKALAGQLAGRRIAAQAVVSEAITLTAATVPGRSRSAWRQALPYAVEEQLAESVDALHFAQAERQADGVIAAAALRREQMDTWLAECEAAGIAVAEMIPDVLLLPYQPGAWSLYRDRLPSGTGDASFERWLVRTGGCAGFACDRTSLPLLLQLALDDSGSAAPAMLRIGVGHGGVDDLDDTFAALRQLGVDCELQPEQPLMAAMAEGYNAAGPRLNLRQADYRSGASWQQTTRPWRLAAGLAVTWLALQGVQQGVDYWQLKREQGQLRAQIAQTFRSALPAARRMVNPIVQMQNELRQLAGAGGPESDTFIELLGRSGQSLAAESALSLRSVRYRQGRLDLLVVGTDLADFDRLRARLERGGTMAVDMRTSKSSGQVESRVTVRKAIAPSARLVARRG